MKVFCGVGLRAGCDVVDQGRDGRGVVTCSRVVVKVNVFCMILVEMKPMRESVCELNERERVEWVDARYSK